MNEAEILLHIRTAFGSMIAGAAAGWWHLPGSSGRGDCDKEGRYHGHGLCQIDDRSFPEFCRGEEWKNAASNIEMGARVIARKRAFLAGRTLGFRFTTDDLEKATIAAYNAGEGRVLRTIMEGCDPDVCTTHCDYAAAVLRHADVYLKL
jgi:hypothetical protein